MLPREICREFMLVDRPIASRLERVVVAFNLTLSHWKIVDFVENAGTCTLVEISRHFFIEKPPVTRVIGHLEEKRLVEQVMGKDKREKRVRLTRAGRELYAACRSALDKAELGLLAGISGEEQRMLLEMLRTIRGNLPIGRRHE